LYGPVPSRRLGLSLGVDIVPFKVCTLDCIYCQLGKTLQKTVERRDYLPIELALTELKDRLAGGLDADFITISGSGEPTLHSRLGELINNIKQITRIPVAILTNGTLLHRPDVRSDCAHADVVLPSLDAGDDDTFQRINRPHSEITLANVIAGLSLFRDEFAGQIWLEVFLAEGINTEPPQIDRIRDAIGRIRPDKVQLNTAVRPTAEAGLNRLNLQRLQAIAAQLGPKAEVVADFSPGRKGKHIESKAESLLSMLKRRPCSLTDICSGLGMPQEDVLRCLVDFQQEGLVDSSRKDGTTFFRAI